MRISMLIPTWRRPKPLRRCLQALATQTRAPDQVVLVVRADDEETRGLLAGLELPYPVQVVEPPRTGVVAALNAGFDAVEGDVVAIADDDTEPLPDWLAKIEAHFEADPQLGGLGGRDRIVGSDEQPPVPADQLSVGTVLWFGRVTGNHHLAAGPPREVDILKGANMSWRTAALGTHRINPALRGRAAEHNWEIELSLAIQADGWRLVYDPEVELLHHEAPRPFGERERQMSAQERFDAVHNQTLALASHLRGARRLRALAYDFLFGTRQNPGPVLALETVLRRTASPGETLGRLRVATRARFAALRQARR